MSSKHIGIEQARKQLGDLADAAHHHGHTTILTRHGRPYAAITPISHLTEERTMTAQPRVFTLISATPGDQMHEGAVEISDPASPLAWDALPAEAKAWAEKHGYGTADDELLYVVPGEVEPAGWPAFVVGRTVDIATYTQGRTVHRYDLLDEIADRYDLTPGQAAAEIHAALDQIVAVAVDGDEVILGERPIRPELVESNPGDVDVHHWLTVSEATADEIREAIAASRENVAD